MGKTLTEAHKKAFYDMLYLDVLRGEDSVGVAAISDAWKPLPPKIELFKSVGTPTNFFAEHAVSTRTRNITYRNVNVLIGHNRAATQGLVNKENAHPFEFENLVGAHNGTVSQASLKDFEGYKDFDIDSKIIFSHLSHTEDIKSVWKDADGAMALVWWDKVEDVLNIIRNKQRPMHFAYSEDEKVLFYASELWMILVSAMRQGIKLKESMEVKPDTLYVFNLDDDDKVFHTEESIPPFVEKPLPNYYQNWSGVSQDDYMGTRNPRKTEYTKIVIRELVDGQNTQAVGFTETGELVKVILGIDKQESAKEKILARGTGQGYYITSDLYRSGINPQQYWVNWKNLTYVELKHGGHILRKEGDAYEIVYGKAPTNVFSEKLAPWYTPERRLNESAYESMVSCGCLNCNNVPNWGNRNELRWLGREDFICGNCQNQPFVRELIEEFENKDKVN